MQHRLHFAASRFDGARLAAAAAWLRSSLIDAAEDADVAELSLEGGACTFVYDLGGDRYDVSLAFVASEWVVTVEHEEPHFVRRHEAHARHQARFDALVTALRAIVASEPTATLRAETAD